MPRPPEDFQSDEWQARVKKWVEDSCREQGIPVKVTNPLTLRRVAYILNGGRADDPDYPQPNRQA